MVPIIVARTIDCGMDPSANRLVSLRKFVGTFCNWSRMGSTNSIRLIRCDKNNDGVRVIRGPCCWIEEAAKRVLRRCCRRCWSANKDCFNIAVDPNKTDDDAATFAVAVAAVSSLLVAAMSSGVCITFCIARIDLRCNTPSEGVRVERGSALRLLVLFPSPISDNPGNNAERSSAVVSDDDAGVAVAAILIVLFDFSSQPKKTHVSLLNYFISSSLSWFSIIIYLSFCSWLQDCHVD